MKVSLDTSTQKEVQVPTVNVYDFPAGLDPSRRSGMTEVVLLVSEDCHELTLVHVRRELCPRRQNRSLHALAVVFVLSFAWESSRLRASAQEATIVGTVTDPTGSVVPAHPSHHQHRHRPNSHLNTNESGQYVVPNLQIGHYNLKSRPRASRSPRGRELC